MRGKVEVLVYPDVDALARAAAVRVAAVASGAVRARGRFCVALAGGSTPRALYTLLASETFAPRLDWARVHVFWGDERCVPPDDAGSNYRLAWETLLEHVPLPVGNIHRVRGEWPCHKAAAAYSAEMQAFFDALFPCFDLVLLGLGEDGHTASLFPGSVALDETVRSVVAVTANYAGRPAQRVTLTLPAINAARQVLFLVAGMAKAAIVQAVLEKANGPLPAQRVRPVSGELAWLLDAAAANRLKKEG
ncbi:MAG: 6-phosphogluconolactonase [Chloroflexota bacterium]